MNIRQEFRDFLRESELNETPENLYNMNGLQSKEDFKNKVIDNFNKISGSDKKSAKKLFNSFSFIIRDNTFYIFNIKTLELYLYIVFIKKNKTMIIKVVRNISKEKNLSFRCYRAILNLPEFDEIVTGDALTTDNINAHKKALGSFKIYIRDSDGDKRIQDENEINHYIKRDNSDEVFVLKESNQFNYIKENFNGDFDEYLNFYFSI